MNRDSSLQHSEIPAKKENILGSGTDNNLPAEKSLDPVDWAKARALAHQALDEAFSFIERIRERPVWQAVPPSVKLEFSEGLPLEGCGMEEAHREFRSKILPYTTGNIHPRFYGWVHGSGSVAGILAEMLAATMNSNCGGRDHGAVYVERCVVDWCKQMFGYPTTASGLLVSGTSMGTLIALTVARNTTAGWDVRQQGLVNGAKRLIAYTSSEGHESIVKAMEILGIGKDSVRRIRVDDQFRMDLDELRRTLRQDRDAGLKPFCLIGTAGTVNTAAIDDLSALAELSRQEDVWLHVDGAFGALCVLSDTLRPRLKDIELADSIAFDFHKWMHVPYDSGCVLVRDGEKHWQTFTTRPSYLQGAERGLSGGGRWFCEYGPELSRGFRALKVWFTLKTYGALALGNMILQNCQQAEYLGQLVCQNSELELLAKPSLNIVCFRYFLKGLADAELDALNEGIVTELQESGIAAPSTTRIKGRLAIRVNITNHRCKREDFDLLILSVLKAGRQKTAKPDTCRVSTAQAE